MWENIVFKKVLGYSLRLAYFLCFLIFPKFYYPAIFFIFYQQYIGITCLNITDKWASILIHVTDIGNILEIFRYLTISYAMKITWYSWNITKLEKATTISLNLQSNHGNNDKKWKHFERLSKPPKIMYFYLSPYFKTGTFNVVLIIQTQSVLFWYPITITQILVISNWNS